MLYVWYPKIRTDLKVIHEDNDLIETEELAGVNALLKRGKHACLTMRMEQWLTKSIGFTRLLIREHKTHDKTAIKKL